jgi:hypothetical protein
VSIWYILCPFGIFFGLWVYCAVGLFYSVLVYCTKKNLAAPNGACVGSCDDSFDLLISLFSDLVPTVQNLNQPRSRHARKTESLFSFTIYISLYIGLWNLQGTLYLFCIVFVIRRNFVLLMLKKFGAMPFFVSS